MFTCLFKYLILGVGRVDSCQALFLKLAVFGVMGRDHTSETVIAAEISVAGTSVVGRCNGRNVYYLLFDWKCSFTDDHACHQFFDCLICFGDVDIEIIGYLS